jgi:hypothetical protein
MKPLALALHDYESFHRDGKLDMPTGLRREDARLCGAPVPQSAAYVCVCNDKRHLISKRNGETHLSKLVDDKQNIEFE